MLNEQIKATGELRITLRDENGNIKEDKTVPNLVVTVGKSVIASRLTGTTSSVMTHMALGTSSATPTGGDTTLGTEIGASRVALATSGGVATANVIAYSAVFNAGVGTGAVVEAGIFNASSAGSMLCRTTFLAVNKAASDTLTIAWSVTIS